MSFASIGFAMFLPVVFVLHWLLPRRAGVQNAVLLLASAVFYATWNVRLLPLLAAAIVIDWGLALALARRTGAARRGLLTLAIVLDLGVLAVFKYAGFFADSLNELLTACGLAGSLPVLQLALPLGISYTTLVRIGYLLDVYYERRGPETSLARFALFTGFFAHLIAGPVVRSHAMLGQYAAPRRLAPDGLSEAATSLLLGFMLKAYVSEKLVEVVRPVFSDPGAYNVVAHWAALPAYALQIFSDFAGYSLMAIGVGLLFGLRLPENFRNPFLATNLFEFWRRWHISLNAWLFDYLFYPWTTGKSWMRGRVVLGFVFVFLISGLWHGAAWTFVLWGLLHGVGLAVRHGWDEFYKGLCRKDRAWVQRRKGRAYAAGAWVLTQGFFVLTLLPFGAPSLGFVASYLKGMVWSSGTACPVLASGQLALCVAIVAAMHLAELGLGARLVRFGRELPAPVHGLMFGAAIVLLALMVPAGAGTFIYANF